MINSLITTKVCKDCKQEFPVSSFKSCVNSQNGRLYYDIRCDECRRLYNRGRDKRASNIVVPGLTVHGLQSRYALSKFNAMLIAHRQNFACGICKRKFTESVRANVDHCHQTGKVRGFLCYKCNTGLGQIGDNQVSLLAAIDYLNQSVSRPEYEI